MPALSAEKAALIHVDKSEKRMELRNAKGAILRSYRIKMGANPQGHKRQQGDERTPEGRYVISGRNAASSYHRSLRISYPNADDITQARRRGVAPGGDIMIHGLPNRFNDTMARLFPDDWTDGCIAVTNAEIEEIWAMVPNGTPIHIVP